MKIILYYILYLIFDDCKTFVRHIVVFPIILDSFYVVKLNPNDKKKQIEFNIRLKKKKIVQLKNINLVYFNNTY